LGVLDSNQLQPAMAVVNVNLNNMLNVKDSRWLQLEVCREYQRSKCSRSDSECKFAHPPTNVEVQNGRVIACYDSIKGRCNREKPPCKYFHPPQHLKDQLLINGRNHLALKNALMLQMSMGPGQSVLPGPTIDYTEFRPVRCIPSSVHDWCEMSQASPYLAGMPQLSAGGYSHYSPMLQVVTPEAAVSSQLGVVPTGAGYGAPANKLQRSDRIEAYPGMMPYKRSAGDKSGMTAIYQQSANSSAAAAAAAAYQAQALMQLQQPYMPVSFSTNVLSVNYTDELGQLLDTLPVCRDFKYGECKRAACKYVHLLDDHVEITDMRVTVCRDAVSGKCLRNACKFYHLPIVLPPATIASTLTR